MSLADHIDDALKHVARLNTAPKARGPQQDDKAVPGHQVHPGDRRVGERPVERGRRSVGRAALVRNFWGLYFFDPPPVTGSRRRPLSANLGGVVLV